MLDYATLVLILCGTANLLREKGRLAFVYFTAANVLLAMRFSTEGNFQMAAGFWILAAANAWGAIR